MTKLQATNPKLHGRRMHPLMRAKVRELVDADPDITAVAVTQQLDVYWEAAVAADSSLKTFEVPGERTIGGLVRRLRVADTSGRWDFRTDVDATSSCPSWPTSSSGAKANGAT